MNFVCTVCGYDKLDEPPYDDKNRGNFDICPCCGFQFGVDDDDKGYTFKAYRDSWIGKGAKWFQPDLKPENWNLENQLKNL